MSENKDDPREVLVLLNSLGFVGITAAQLKAFMKDLKIYRKIKEREKQQRKEIKTKVTNTQRALIKEALGHQKTVYLSESNSHDSEPLVKIRIKYLSKEEDVETEKCSKTTTIKSSQKQQHQKKDDAHISELDRVNYEHLNARACSDISKNRQTISKSVIKSGHVTGTEEKSLQEHPMDKPDLLTHANRPRSKSATSDPTGNIRVQSALSATSSVNSKHKSFIRPWRLQSEAQKNVVNKKCDPVALYQKYQEEWKRISFPGEAKHSKVRWAVREKMLGGDLLPVPLPRKFVSMPILKKK